jgi:hypothetical protein
LPINGIKPYYMKTIILIFALVIAAVTGYSQTQVEFVSFNAEKVSNTVLLTWSPSIHPETNHFEIQRSDDGINWRVIALMFPYEDATVSHTYKYSDKISAEGNMQYRIRQIDINKKENFSQVKMITAIAGK